MPKKEYVTIPVYYNKIVNQLKQYQVKFYRLIVIVDMNKQNHLTWTPNP